MHYKKIWKVWIKTAEIIGNIQMVVILTVIYWTMLLVIALPFKLLSDPLSLKKSRATTWIIRNNRINDLESMRKQG